MCEDIGVKRSATIAPNAHPKIALPISSIATLHTDSYSGELAISPKNTYESNISINSASKISKKQAAENVSQKAFHPPPTKINK